jgi:hypothetical protein
MAQDIVSGLFGPTPEQLEQARMRALDEMAWVRSEDPQRMYRAALMSGAGGLAGGLARAAGYEDRGVIQAKAREQIMSGADTATPEGLLAAAKAAGVRGDVRMQLQLQQLAQAKAAEQQKMKLELAKDALATRKQEFQEREAFELKKREAEARIEQNAEKIADARTSAAERAELQRESNEIKRMLGLAMVAVRQSAVDAKGGADAPPKNLSREARLKWELDNGMITQEVYNQAMAGTSGGKNQAKVEAMKAAEEQKRQAIDIKLNNLLGPGGVIGQAEKDIGTTSTGFIGQMLGGIGGTSAFDLKEAAKTITSTLTIETINEMKRQSPTGATGLGSIAIKELELLMSSVRSLESAQSTGRIKENLAAIKKHLNGWRTAVAAAKSKNIPTQADIEVGADSTPKPSSPASNQPVDTNAEARAWLAANPNDPRAAAVRAKLGMK